MLSWPPFFARPWHVAANRDTIERVHLLAHILRLVIEPNGRQHADVQKLGLNVKKLEEATSEALSSFFMDNETNAKKKPYLTEIFKVARQEERFKNGEIGKFDKSSLRCDCFEDATDGSISVAAQTNRQKSTL